MEAISVFLDSFAPAWRMATEGGPGTLDPADNVDVMDSMDILHRTGSQISGSWLGGCYDMFCRNRAST